MNTTHSSRISRTRMICAVGIGIALYVALSLCLQVPVFENYYLCLGYSVMMVYCYTFGAVSGSMLGFLGCIFYCLITSGLRGMPGWSAGNIIIGIIMGTTFRMTKHWRHAGVRYAIWLAAAIASAALAMLLVKSGVESLLYAHPLPVRAVKNSYAFVADAVVMAVSLPLCPVMDRAARRILRRA